MTHMVIRIPFVRHLGRFSNSCRPIARANPRVTLERRVPLQLFSGALTECKIAEYQIESLHTGNVRCPVGNSVGLQYPFVRHRPTIGGKR